MARVKLFNRDEVLQKAMELFWEKGYASTSLSDLTSHLGIGKGSFYATFKSKQALFEEAFDLYGNSRQGFLKDLLDSEPNTKKGVKKLLKLSLDESLKDDKRRGCMIANTCSNYSDINEVMENKLIEHNAFVQDTLTNYLMQGNIKSKKAETIATIIVTFLMGMSQQAKFKNDRKSYIRSINKLVGLLD